MIGLAAFPLAAGAAGDGPVMSKVIIYPAPQDSIARLKQEGITTVRNYGSYWLVETTDSQVKRLKQEYGNRAIPADYLNRIELSTVTIDTTRGEPAIPDALRSYPSGGKNLRLIQFVGPVQPEWLKQVQAAGDVRIVGYVPNNAYVVSLDAAAEQKIASLMTPNGPIQWLSPYHPYYKFRPALSQATNATIKVRVAVVDGPEARATIAALQQFNVGAQREATHESGQQVVGLEVTPQDLASMAQLPDVLWMTRVWPIKTMDERADLLEASRTNQLPGHSPVPGIDNYMNFLTNQVGFSTTPEEYPVIDLADTVFPAFGAADFFVLGNPANESRDVGYLSLCNPSATLCDIHADWTTSTAVGANISETASNEDSVGFRLGLGVSPFGRFANTIIFSLQGTLCTTCEGDFTPSGDWHYLTLNQYVDHRARISNNSWGEGVVVGGGGNTGMYDGLSKAFDDSVRDASLAGQLTNGQAGVQFNQELVIVCAAGNTGADDLGAGGFVDQIVVPPATAKNVITAGATENVRPAAETTGPCGLNIGDADNSFDMAFFSSFGPTVDGRFKPEIVAPGTAIFALDGVITNLYDCVSGTSFAAPAVSGGIQLLWWYFENRLQDEQGNFLLQPSPAMAKAYLCNSARYLPIASPQYPSIPDTLPSIAQGMGMMDLQRMFDGVPRIIRDESTPRATDISLITTNPIPQQTYFSRSGQSYEIDGQIADPTSPFRVTVAWTDPPGNPAVLQQLVNNLDLQVTIGGQTYLGNRFSGPNSVPNTDSSVPGAGLPDTINNMQSVFLPPGQTGAWSVIVRAADIAGNAVSNVPESIVGQDFALVVYNAATTNRSDVPTLTTNDACQTALPIGAFPFSFTNTLSTAVYHKTIPSPSAAMGGVQEFFRIVNPSPPTPGTTFSVDTSGSGFNTVLSVWEADALQLVVPTHAECGVLQELTSDSGAGSPFSSVSFTADGTNDYYIVVEPLNDGPGGTLVLNVNATQSGITITPTSLTFGDQVQGTTSAVQNVTYQNGGSGAVTVNNVTITGADPSDFTIISANCIGNPLAPTTNCSVSVEFTPQGTGLRTANLVFTDTDTGSPRVVPLSGTGLSPAPVVCLGSSGEIVFSNTAVNVAGAPQTIVVTNCGTAALTITSVGFVGSETNDFSDVSSCPLPATVAPGSDCSIAITFTPTATGLREATLQIYNSANPSVPVSVLCVGTGFIAAPALCADSSVNFGSLTVGSTGLVQSLTITNCGTAPLVITNIAITAGNAGDFIVSTCTNVLAGSTCATIPTGGTYAVSLKFAPTAGGPRSATLAITDNIADGPQSITLTGNGNLSQPDAAIGKNTNLKKMIGFGVFSTNGISANGITEGLSQNVPRQKPEAIQEGKNPVKYYIAVLNAGSGSDQFNVQSTQTSGGQGFTVRYWVGANPSDNFEITAAVEAGTFAMGTMGPGAVTGPSTMILAEVFADKTIVEKGTTAIYTLTFSSASDPTRQDAVRIAAVAR
jgi:hypothetical protein